MKIINAKIILLPSTESVNRLGDILVKVKVSEHAPEDIFIQNNPNDLVPDYLKAHHMYFVSDEPLADGDFRYDAVQNKIIQLTDIHAAHLSNVSNEKTKTYYKVEATTDRFLMHLPHIPEQWIKETYIPSFDKIKTVALPVGRVYYKGLGVTLLDKQPDDSDFVNVIYNLDCTTYAVKKSDLTILPRVKGKDVIILTNNEVKEIEQVESAHAANHIPTQSQPKDIIDLSKITRVEVIDHSLPIDDPRYGRAYTNYNVKSLELSYQDNNTTLKLFIK